MKFILSFLDYQIQYHRDSYQKLREFKTKIEKPETYTAPEKLYDEARRKHKSSRHSEKIYDKKASIKKDSFRVKRRSGRSTGQPESVYESIKRHSTHIPDKSRKNSSHYKIENKKSNDSGYSQGFSSPAGKICRAIFDYDRGVENELSFQAHEEIEILSADNKNLSFFGRTVNDSRFGKFPMNVVEIVK